MLMEYCLFLSMLRMCRSIHENSRLAEIVKGVQKLEFAILADTGLTGW